MLSELQPIIIIRDLIMRYHKRVITFKIISLRRMELGRKIRYQKVEVTSTTMGIL